VLLSEAKNRNSKRIKSTEQKSIIMLRCVLFLFLFLLVLLLLLWLLLLLLLLLLAAADAGAEADRRAARAGRRGGAACARSLLRRNGNLFSPSFKTNLLINCDHNLCDHNWCKRQPQQMLTAYCAVLL
jgi:hypothetical protein